jgi:putative hemolysin
VQQRYCAAGVSNSMPVSPPRLKTDSRKLAVGQPALLAQHRAEAGLAEKAVDYCLKAGQQAMARSRPAWMKEGFPTPDRAVAVRKDRSARGRIPVSISCSRPKKFAASSALKGRRPGYGALARVFLPNPQTMRRVALGGAWLVETEGINKSQKGALLRRLES